ncbi:MAG TPA: C25 family cysteine peptidase, partial [bacterium]
MIFKFDKRFYSIGLLFFLFIFFIIENCWGFSNRAVFEVIESNDDRIVFEIKPYNLKFMERPLNGEMFEIPQIEGYQWLTTPGKPQLPSASVLIGIPGNGAPSIQILDYQTSLLGPKNIYPAPELTLTGSADEEYLTEQSFLDPESYSQNNFYPAEFVQITSINTLRQQRIARVEFHPVQYNPVSKQLQKIERLKFAVVFDRSASQTKQSTEPVLIDISNSFEPIYQRLLANYSAARHWRQSTSIPDMTSRLTKKATDWYIPSAIFYKLFVEEQGIYQLDSVYLDSIGIDVRAIDPRTLKIYNKGKQLPIFVFGEEDGRFDESDYIRFYGARNQGDSTYFDPYTDTNIYWLTWGGELGVRMSSKTTATEAGAEIQEYLKTIHLEQDKVYHEGDNSIAIINTEMVSGEGWVWRFFYPGDREVISIPTTNVSESSVPCHLRIKLRGTTIDRIRPNHHVKVLLNNNLIGDFYFNGTEDYLFEVNLPSVQDGENKLELTSVGDTGAKIDQFYLDWIELEYPRQFVANNDALQFAVSNGGNPVANATIWGFTDPNIQLFDLTNQTVISNPQITPGKRLICKVVSAGFDDGFFVQFQINSENIISQWHRGHNLVEIDEVSGKVLATKHFDTHFSAAESDSMAQYIQQLPEGRIVLATIMDEGSQNLTAAAYLALESLGSQLIRGVGFRDSWAMIGRKGAAIGTVPEALQSRGSGVAIIKDTLLVAGSGQDCYLTFADTLKPFQSYFAVSNKGVKYPVAARLDTTADLTSTQNGADLIVITHGNFLSSAQHLADYRAEHNGLRVKVVDVEDIYDEFNFGLINPQSIKDFLNYTYDHWQSPAPSYVIFFGDASWDFKKNLEANAKENYVPSYGNPVSDNWFVCFDGKDDFLPEIFVGRIPVESSAQAEIVVNKIMAYENTPTGSWKKNVLFITGGFNKSEQSLFMNQTNYLITNLVIPPPASCRALQINKTTEGYFEGEKKNDILAKINHGTMWVNFLGHAGSRTWDLMFNHSDVEELSNQNQYPFITSMTCHTGRFADPENSFSEHFLLAENKGAIAFWATTGWGYVFQDNILLKNLFISSLLDTTHLLGNATTYAKLKLWEGYGNSIYNISSIHQYTLIGDPLTDLTLPEKPDLTMGPSDVSFSPYAPLESDSSVTISIKIQNWGLATSDSFKVDIYDIMQNQIIPIETGISMPPIGLEDSLTIYWNLRDQAGEHVIRVVLDQENAIEEINEENNSYDYPLYVYSSKISVSKPFDFQVISPQNITLQVNNATSTSVAQSSLFYQFELDTTDSFDSQLHITSPKIPQGIIVTRWQVPPLLDATTYFWRCRTIQDNEVSKWITASFFTQADSPRFIWKQQHLEQFIHNNYQNTLLSSRGIQIKPRVFVLEVESAGYEDGNYARILINAQAVLEPHRGHNIVVIDPTNGEVLFVKKFDTLDSQDEANAMANFINSVAEGSYVLCAIMDEGSYNMTETAYQALESIGSKLCRNVGFRDSWAIIGRKGAPIGSAVERYSPHGQGIAVVADTMINYPLKGSISSAPIGPANGWNYIAWTEDGSKPGSDITMDIIGYNKKTASWDTLFTTLSKNEEENLNSINSIHYPLIKLKANLSDDDGLDTPFLKEWLISYEPVADPAISSQSVTFSSDTLMEGDELKMEIKVFNTGMVVADSVKLRFGLGTPDSGNVRLFEDKILTRIAVDSFKILKQSWEGIGKIGNDQLFIEIDPDDQVNELTEGNNYFSRKVVVLSDTMKPRIAVTYDGKSIVMEDFVSKQPVILIDVYDNSILSSTSDTTQVNLFFDNDRISYSGNENVLSLLPLNKSEDTKLRASLKFTPQLFDGDHSLEVFVRDQRNNVAYHRDFFQVVSDFKLLNVFNYPNPFQNDTEFTVQLTQPADKVTIKIFTVAGRLIRMIENYNCESGFHR